MDFVFDMQRFATDYSTFYTTSGSESLTKLIEADWATGQFSWVTNRDEEGQVSKALIEDAWSVGFFSLKGSFTYNGNTVTALGSTTVEEQTSKTTLTAPKSGYNAYLVASVGGDSNSSTTPSLQLHSVAIVDSNGLVTVVPLSDLSASSTITGSISVNAPDSAFTYARAEELNSNIQLGFNKVADGAVLTDLIVGDVVNTASLDANAKVTVNGKAFTSGKDKNNLTIVPATDTDGSTASLYSGTVQLSANESVESLLLLSGSDSSKYADDIKLSYTKGDSNTTSVTHLIVTANKGQLFGLTGLTAQGDKVTVDKSPAKVGSANVSNATVTYEVLDEAGTMIKRTVKTASASDPDPASPYVTYLTLSKAGSDVCSGSYKAAALTAANAWGEGFDTEAAKKTSSVYYMDLGAISTDEDTNLARMATGTYLGGDADQDHTSTAATPTYTNKSYNDSFLANSGHYYLQVKTTTSAATSTKPSVTTIDGITLMQSAANGALSAVKASAGEYTGNLHITVENNALVNYKLPAATSREWSLWIDGAAFGSTFTNLGKKDAISTASTEEALDLKKGTYTVYKADDGAQKEVTTITITGDGVTAAYDSDATAPDNGLSFMNFVSNKESVKVETYTDESGLVTTLYESTVGKVNNRSIITVTRTITDANGWQTIASSTTDITDEVVKTALANMDLQDFDFADVDSTPTYVSNFDWTLAKNTTGYFAITGSSVNLKEGTATINAKKHNGNNGYIAATVDANGTVTLSKLVYDEDNGLIADTENEFVGNLNITASKTASLTWDRSTLLGEGGMNEDAVTLTITDAAEGSTFNGFQTGDTISTTKLAAEKSITIDDKTYTAATNNDTLKFKFDNDEGAVVTGGNLLMPQNNQEPYSVFVTKTAKSSVLDKISTSTDSLSEFTLSVASDGSYKVTALEAGDRFSVTPTDGEISNYVVSNGTIFRFIGTTVQVASISQGSIANSVLNDANKWAATDVTFTAAGDGILTSQYGLATVDLALADKQAAADAKKNGEADAEYAFVYDSYVKAGTTKSTANKVPALKAVVSDVETAEALASTVNNAVQTAIGISETVSADDSASVYEADENVTQSIKAADGWRVYGSKGDDTLTGAAKGKDILAGGEGDDTLAGGGAADTFLFFGQDSGKDTVTGYASGKDKIVFFGGDSCDYFFTTDDSGLTAYGLAGAELDSKSADVILANGEGGDTVTLKGMGNGKAVTINGRDYHFGNGSTPTKGATFTYVDGDYYLGNTSGANTLKVGTDKLKATKTTLGEALKVNLSDEGHYLNINTVDASSSANEVELTAATVAAGKTGSTLKGGTYMSTLNSGAGNDTLVGGSGLDDFHLTTEANGDDIIKSYTSGKDVLSVGDRTQAELAELVAVQGSIKADGKNVVMGSEGNSVTIEGAVNSTKAVNFSYTIQDEQSGESKDQLAAVYVGKAGNANKFASNTYNWDSTADSTYYVGNDTANDTLKLGKADKGSIVIDMATEAIKYQSIDAIDASAVAFDQKTEGGKYVDTAGVIGDEDSRKRVGVEVRAGDTALTITGTKYSDVISCGYKTTVNYSVGKSGNDSITNFSADDIIQLNNLGKSDIDALGTAIDKANAASGDLSVTLGGSTLSVKAAEGAGGLWKYDSTSKQIQRIAVAN